MRVVKAYGIRYLATPEELKYWLCPLIAKNEVEQKLFCKVFDKYLNDIGQLPEANIELPWWQTLPKWMIALLLSLLLLGIGEGFRRLFFSPTKEDTIQYVVDYKLGKEAVELGDTVKGINQSRDFRDTFQLDFRWEILDAESGEVELVEEENTDLMLIAKTFGSSPRKKIRLIGIDKATGKRDTTATRDITLLCNNPPLIDTIVAPIQINHETKLDFEAKPLDNRNYQYEWAFGDEQKQGKQVSHRFQKMGAANVTLTAIIEAEGVCETRVTKNISIGSLKPPLAFKKLEKDQMLPVAVIGEGMWLLIALLAFLAAWFWYKAMNKQPEKLQVIDEEKRLLKKFEATNNAPYFIPFRPKHKLIRPESSLYLFAKVLR